MAHHITNVEAQSAEQQGMRVVLLGTQAGPSIHAERYGIASAVVVDGATYMVDCGRGSASQYVRAGLRLDSLRNILITHLHADHVADYYNMFMLGGGPPNAMGDTLRGEVGVYGPGPAGFLAMPVRPDPPTVSPDNPTPGIADLTARMHEAFAYGANDFIRAGQRDIRSLVEVHEIEVPRDGISAESTAPPMTPFPVFEDDRVRVTGILVPHGAVFPAFAFRFDSDYGSVTFSGDTTYSQNLEDLAAGTDILVHEAQNIEGANISDQLRSLFQRLHVDVQKVGSIAERCGAGTLVLSHIADITNRRIDPVQWAEWAQAGYSGRVIVGEDLQIIDVSQKRPAAG